MSEIGPRKVVDFERALLSGSADLSAVAHEVGASAAQVGSPLQEVFGTLKRAYAAVDQPEPEFEVAAAAAVAWSEAVVAHHHSTSCDDPLTSLASMPHLRSRIDDIYRLADRDGFNVRAKYAFLVLELPPTPKTPLAGQLAMLEAAVAVRTVYNGDETIAQVAPRRIACLVESKRTDRPSIDLLQVLIKRTVEGPNEARLWVERLPRVIEGTAWLLNELARPMA